MKNVASFAVLGALALLPLVVSSSYLLHVLIHIGIFTICAMSLNLLLGYTGQLSLGHVAFFGLGAYTSALCSLGFTLEGTDSVAFVVNPKPIWFSFLAAIIISGFFGWIIGKLSFRVRGAYFVVVMVSFVEVIRMTALNWVSLTQGPMALNNIPPFSIEIPGLFAFVIRTKIQSYYLVLIVGVIAFVVISRLVTSRFGRAMIALRESEPLALSVGIDVTHFLVVAAVISAAIAGAAGSVYAHYVKVVDPDIFSFIYTVTMVIMVVAGGKGTLAGPVVGGLLFGGLPPALRGLSGPEFQWIIYGSLMIVLVFLLPKGIVPTIRQIWMHKYRSSQGDEQGRAGAVLSAIRVSREGRKA